MKTILHLSCSMSILVPSLETCTRESLSSDLQPFRLPAPIRSDSDEEALHGSDSLDFSQWLDIRTRKSKLGSPDFKHKPADKSLWICRGHNPPWVQEERRKRGLNAVEAGDGEFFAAVNKETRNRDTNGIYTHDNQQRSQSDTIKAISLVALLKACAKQRNLHDGSKLHTEIADKGLLTNIFVGNTLVHMYAQCGALDKAQDVFEELPVRTVVSWNALITGYAQEGCGDEAFACLEEMQLEGFAPNVVTFACVLNACGSIGDAKKGQALHSDIVKYGLLREGMILCTALVDMYANCGMLAEAQQVFNTLLVRDVVCWTALIAGYVQHGHGKEALECYKKMHLEGCSPNVVTYACILKACGSPVFLERGQDTHAKIISEGLLDGDVVIGNALVDMYAKCGVLEKAQAVFNELQNPDLVSWTMLITGYAQNGLGEEALTCFEGMQCEGFLPDAVTFSGLMKACSSIGFVSQAQGIHFEIVRDGSLEGNRIVCTALVDMYAKCGMLAEAQELFDKMPTRDVIVWTALMEGYAQLGKDEVVFSAFHKMIDEGNKPNCITFIVLLNSCCHRGLLDEGEVYFEMISKIYDMSPTLEHHTCMVDLFGRAGNLDRAVVVIEKMPFSASLMIWHALICACRQCGNMELGSWAFKHASQLNVKDASTYICVRNLYAGGSTQENDNEMGSWTDSEDNYFQ